MSVLSDFLTTDYAAHHGVTWDSSKMSLRTESPASICFEIEDKRPSIVQLAGHGVSIIRRKDEMVEVLDLEDFMKQIHGSDNTPSSCDFAVSPQVGTSFLILNELTRTKSEYIKRFTQPKTGEEREGKMDVAKKQLTETINRFYEVSDFCDQYADKTALFSCRLSDKSKNGIMAKSAKSFNRGIYSLQRMKLHESLPHGFEFRVRVYSEEYKIG